MNKIIALILFTIATPLLAQERSIHMRSLLTQERAAVAAAEMEGVKAVCGCVTNDGSVFNVAGVESHEDCEAVEDQPYKVSSNLIVSLLACGVKYMSSTYKATGSFLPTSNPQPQAKPVTRPTGSFSDLGRMTPAKPTPGTVTQRDGYHERVDARGHTWTAPGKYRDPAEGAGHE